MKDSKKPFLPYNLQFFAEPGDAPEPTPAPAPVPTPNPDPEPNPEPSLTAEEQLAKLMAENKRLKAATDKATAEAAENKRKLREKMSEQEKYDLEKAEREAQFQNEFQQLKRESQITKLEKNYLALGYDAKLATQAANAQYDGDTDEVFRISQAHQDFLKKKLEAEWMKNSPAPPAGNKNDQTEDPFLSGFKY